MRRQSLSRQGDAALNREAPAAPGRHRSTVRVSASRQRRQAHPAQHAVTANMPQARLRRSCSSRSGQGAGASPDVILLPALTECPRSSTPKSVASGTRYWQLTTAFSSPCRLSDDTPLLSNGILAMSAAPSDWRWVRTTRNFTSFQRTGVSGFASVSRALIGQENVIVCKSELVGTVIDCVAITGSAPLAKVTGPGIPDGWQCYRGFRPLHPAAFSGLDEKFLALNPLPNAAIELSGGIASARSAWFRASRPSYAFSAQNLHRVS